MKSFLTLAFTLIATPAFSEISRQCYNEAMSLEVNTILDSDANEAVVLDLTDEEGRRQRLISNGVEGHNFGFYAVFEGLSSEFTTGILTQSKLLVIIGSQARLAENGVVHHFSCL